MEDYIRRYISSTKTALNRRLDIDTQFQSVACAMREQVEDIQNRVAKGERVIPEIRYADIAADQVSPDTINQIHTRGCVIVRNVFDQRTAEQWNTDIGEYLDVNHYAEAARTKAGIDNYFGDLASANPQIFGIYWSKPQVAARQAPSMALTKRFLNHLWDNSSPTGPEFDPDHDFAYADRTRRRAPGDKTLGLSPHMDAGSYERWVDPAFQKIYEPIFSGHWAHYNPWTAAHRTQTREYVSPAVSSMFRTFQGWTALTPQGKGDGTLQLLPIANSIAYTLLRSLMPDVPREKFCLAEPGRALGINHKWHPDLMPGMISIPLVEPGDTVWWHPDVIHGVEDEHHGHDYASVIYIGASPACPKNSAYATRQATHFLDGRSAPDFAAEDYEVSFKGRATLEDLTALGRTQMALS